MICNVIFLLIGLLIGFYISYHFNFILRKILKIKPKYHNHKITYLGINYNVTISIDKVNELIYLYLDSGNKSFSTINIKTKTKTNKCIDGLYQFNFYNIRRLKDNNKEKYYIDLFENNKIKLFIENIDICDIYPISK
jgi:uncharacterized protein YneF (UPF0154 family)